MAGGDPGGAHDERPECGRALGMSRNAAYEAAVRGEIKTVRFGRIYRVPTAWLRRTLELPEQRDREAA